MPRWLAMCADVGRLDAEHAVAGFLEIRQQRAVIGADIDHEIVFPQAQHRRGFAGEIGEIVAQQLRGAAGVGIVRRKDDDGIDREAELHQLAVAAVEQVGREPRLLPRHDADPHHLVDRRHVAEREHVIERGVAAYLTALDRDAGAGAGGARDFARTQNVVSVSSTRSGFGRQVGVAPVPVECRLEAFVERHARLIAQPGELRNVGTAPRCSARGSLAGNQLDLASGRAPRRGAQDPRSSPPPSCRRDRCRDARLFRASPGCRRRDRR